MTDLNLIQALRSLSVETGSLACLGCSYERDCGIHGCAIMRATADHLAALQAENAELRTQHRIERCEASGYDCAELGRLRAALARVEEERDVAYKEIERMKGIMHEQGIMVIPSKYPGGRSAWNIKRDAQWEG